MTVILILLCLAIAGRELIIASDKRLPRAQADIAELRRRLDERDEVLREMRDRLLAGAQRTEDTWDSCHRLARSLNTAEATLGEMRRHLVRGLDQAAEVSLGGEPRGTVRGLLLGRGAASLEPLGRLYDRLADCQGLRVELRERVGGPSWNVRYFLSGPAPRELERDFISLVSELRASPPRQGGTAPSAGSAALCSLALGLHGVDGDTAQIGPLVVVRTADALLCGVLPLADLHGPEAERLLVDAEATAERLRELPESRVCDLSSLHEPTPEPVAATATVTGAETRAETSTETRAGTSRETSTEDTETERGAEAETAS